MNREANNERGELTLTLVVPPYGLWILIAGMLAMATTGVYTAAGELKPTATKKTTESAPAVG